MSILHLDAARGRSVRSGQDGHSRLGEVLERDGARVRVVVGLLREARNLLLHENSVVPDPIEGWGLLDTGASRTCVDAETARKLQLPTLGWIDVVSTAGSASLRQLHPIQVQLPELSFELDIPNAIAAPLEGTGLVALIGRDVLRRCTLFYNGLPGEITLSA